MPAHFLQSQKQIGTYFIPYHKEGITAMARSLWIWPIHWYLVEDCHLNGAWVRKGVCSRSLPHGPYNLPGSVTLTVSVITNDARWSLKECPSGRITHRLLGILIKVLCMFWWTYTPWYVALVDTECLNIKHHVKMCVELLIMGWFYWTHKAIE